MKIEVNIGEMLLHGFPAEQRGLIAEGVKTELALLLKRDGLPAGDPRPVESYPPAAQIAREIYRKIGGAL